MCIILQIEIYPYDRSISIERMNLLFKLQLDIFLQNLPEEIWLMLWTCSEVFGLADEQERVQKKTFTNWINSYLTQVRNKSKTGFEQK